MSEHPADSRRVDVTDEDVSKAKDAQSETTPKKDKPAAKKTAASK